jgi:toxin ParE1/3/4
MQCDIVWLDQARDDVFSILEFIASENPNAAVRYINGLEDLVLQLKDFPDSGRVYDEKYRCLIYRNHVIFYRSEPGLVTIVTVIDGRRDLSWILSD